VAFHPTVAAGCRAVENVVAAGLQAAALEYLDAGALRASAAAFPMDVPDGAGLMVIAEADGTAAQAAALQAELVEALGEGALAVHAPASPREVRELWRWRGGVSIAVTAQRGGKVSEDIVVPLDRLEEAIEETLAIGARHDLDTCSWGHAGDGNLHSTFMVAPGDSDELARAARAAQELFALARSLGGSVSGEHGLGLVKAGQLEGQWGPAALALHERVKDAFDPKGLFNPGKKVARTP
jgi:FAD/FMN-containing dehydrogenase